MKVLLSGHSESHPERFIACIDEIGQVVSIMFDLHLPSGDACVGFNYQLLDYHPTHCKWLVINICEL